MDATATIAGIVMTGVFSTLVAIINSNARSAATEQKFKDTFEVIQKRLDELSDTDSCCVALKEDVAVIKDNISEMAAAINQLKAESSQADTLMMKTNMLLIRHTINDGYRVFAKAGEIDKKTKDSLLALGDVYLKDYHGNSFVEDELNILRELPMV